MEDTESLHENLTTSLLEEVFNTIETEPEPIKTSKQSCGRTSFLEEEFNTDVEYALGKKKHNETKKLSRESLNLDEAEKEPSLIQEDDINPSRDDDPFEDGEGTKWITSGVSLQSNPKRKSNCFSENNPTSGKSWSDVKQSLQEKLGTKISKTDESNKSKDLLVDPVFHMRIINPKVSSTVLKNKMIGREAVLPLKIRQYLGSKDVKDVNWVTGGAIVGKFATKSQKGNQYMIWTLSDLKGDIKVISVFLFGTAYQEYWKLPLGTVVGILNPSLLENTRNKSEATLRVDNSDRIMIFGTSKDYGTCKSKKANGENCTAVVNLSSCEYCIYHVKQIYDKASRRQELQSGFTGKGLTNLQNKVLGKNEVFYGGKSYMAIPAKQGLKTGTNSRERFRTMVEAPVDRTKIQKDRELLQRLSGEITTKSKASNGPNESDKSDRQEARKSLGEVVTNKPQVNSPGGGDVVKPKVEKMIDLDIPITHKQVLRAKANAIKFIQKHGPLKKPDDTARKKKTPEQILAIKRKLEAEEGERKKRKLDDDKEKDGKTLLKEKLERSGITEKFLQVMNSESVNPELLSMAETEEREKYFSRLEVKERMEEKMATTYKMDCKAVRCLKCNYKSFSASELCKKEKHPLKLVNAVKRFWKCGDCSARTVCLELVPLHSCKVCGSSKWERASMLPEKKAPLLPNEALSIRGHEEKFVGSSVRNPNINLLVPDEPS